MRLRFRLAGPGPRAMAWSIDLLLKAGVLLVFGVVVAIFQLFPILSGIGQGAFLLAMFTIEWFYGAFWETLTGGRTPGKFALQLRVVRYDGAPASMPDFVLRHLLSGVDFLPFGYAVGVLTMLIDPRLRRIGDLVAGTVVVHEDRGSVLSELVIDPPVTEAERELLPARIQLQTDELRLIEELLRRYRSLSRERAEELAELFAPALSKRTGVEAPTSLRVLQLVYARVAQKDRQGSELTDSFFEPNSKAPEELSA